jgi:hypothetical protein
MKPGTEQWSSARGKVCPGPKRIAQIPAVVARAIDIYRIINPGKIPELPSSLPSSPVLLKRNEDPMQVFDWPAGDQDKVLIVPTGGMSAVTKRSWFSIVCDGTMDLVEVWFNGDMQEGMQHHKWEKIVKGQRLYWELPDRCTQVFLHYRGASGPVGGCLEFEAK